MEEHNITKEKVKQALEGYEFPGMTNLKIALELGYSGPTVYITFDSSVQPEYNFEHLVDLSKRLGTTKINFSSFLECSGCPTCSYGKNYEFSLVCENVKLK
jgi:hypothetical protein